VTFFPDASSDSAEIELRQTDREDGMHVLVTVNGLTGELTFQTFTPPSEEDKQRAQWEKDNPIEGLPEFTGFAPAAPPCPDH